MWEGFWIRLWTVMSLFCSMSRVAGWCMLKKITKHASFLYLCIFENVFNKARETSETGSILWYFRPQLAWSEIQRRHFVRNLPKILIAVLRVKKRPWRYEGKFAFQTIAIELHKTKNKNNKKRTHKIINLYIILISNLTSI